MATRYFAAGSRNTRLVPANRVGYVMAPVRSGHPFVAEAAGCKTYTFRLDSCSRRNTCERALRIGVLMYVPVGIDLEYD